MLNETHPNLPHDRRQRTTGIGAPEVGFLVGFVAAVTGISLLSIAAALIVAGALVMAASWRFA
jgi:hypothetical protein